MAITRVQGTKGTSSSSTTTVSLPSAPTSGNLIVLRFASDDYNGTPDSGWTQSTGMEQQTFHGGYLWWRISNGTNSFPYTIGSASGSSYILEEWSGLDGTAPYDVSNGTFTQSSATTQATPSITPSSGSRLLLAMMGGSSNVDLSAQTGSFDNSFTTDAYQGNNIGSTRDWVMAGSRVVTADGATGYSTTGSSVPNTLQSRSGLIIAFKAASGGGGTVTGTLAATESGSDSASLSGSVASSGTLAATETGSDTASFSGSVTAAGVSGSMAAAETGSDTAALSGSVETSGTLATTEAGSDSASISGSVEASGSLAATEAGSDTASFSGTISAAGVSGSLAVTESGQDTASFTGSVAPVGSLAATEGGSDSAAFTGTVAAAQPGTMTVITPSTGLFSRTVPTSGTMTLVAKTTGQFQRAS